MTREQWQKVKGIMALALEQPPASRRAFVHEAAAGDPDLLAELTSLIDASERTDGFSLDRGVAMPTGWVPPDEFFAATPSSTYSKVCSRCHSRYGPLVFVCPQDGEALTDDPEALVGVTLDGLYEIEKLVGLGAMGRVYSARHALLRDRVAIKVLRGDLALNADFVKRFLREGRAARAMNHPNAVTVHDLRTTADGLTYMVQEFIDGHTLRAEMEQRGPMPLDEALGLLEPIAAALDEAHAHGIVHRDLKPENVVIGSVSGKPVVKVADLGIAKLLEPETSRDVSSTALTEPGQVMGTPQYMSPEQWGAPADDGGPDIDARADVYSFGVIAFELLTGSKPFEANSVRQLCLAHISRPPPDVRDLAPGTPGTVATAIARALSKDRRERPATCGALLAEMRGTPVHAATTAGPAGAGIRQRRMAVLVAGIIFVLFAAGAAFVRFGLSPSVPTPASGPAAPAIPAAVPVALECTAHVQKYRNGRPFKPPLPVAVDRTLVVEQGDRIRFRLQAPEAGWLYVLNETHVGTGPLPELRVLFPVPWTNDGNAALSPGQAISLPSDAERWIEFDAVRGSEAFWLVWSTQPLAAFDGLAARANPSDRGIVDTVQAGAIRELLDTAPLAVAEADASAGTTRIRGGDGLVAYRLDVQHY